MPKKLKQNNRDPDLDARAQRIKKRRRKLGISQTQAARKAGVNLSLWNKYENGKFEHSREEEKIALALEMDLDELRTGQQKNKTELIFVCGKHEERIKIDDDYPVIQPPSPVITWEQAGRTVFSARDVKGDVKYAQRYQKTNVEAFVLVMDGDSMQNSSMSAPSFLPGDMLHFDPITPTSIQPKPGDYVIARRRKERTAIFRQLVSDCGKQYLVAPNPRYPVIELTDDIKIFGILIFQGRDLRS
jgi:SOS-response transcriptional repressor LexA